jgi:hypothetical protein
MRLTADMALIILLTHGTPDSCLQTQQHCMVFHPSYGILAGLLACLAFRTDSNSRFKSGVRVKNGGDGCSKINSRDDNTSHLVYS